MIKTLLIPGRDGSPAPHWQDWWAATDPTALTVDPPAPAGGEKRMRQLFRRPPSLRDRLLLGLLLAGWAGLIAAIFLQ